ncbi:MAG: single-stranded DNA-binding protein [Deltaproteobacteria bacterium]|jgi:single-strand DNA-binding protein|nr:single-stranded DNA-binding protein [Deltaproteobacteria bacterium]
MADGLNKVMLIGNLGKDPVHRVTSNNKDVVDFSIATTESWRGQDGNREQRTEWHRIVAWGKTAINVKDHLSKGSKVYIEGKLQTRKWTDKNNVDKYTTEIVARSVLFLDPPPSVSKSYQDGSVRPEGPAPGPDNYEDDDIPF